MARSPKAARDHYLKRIEPQVIEQIESIIDDILGKIYLGIPGEKVVINLYNFQLAGYVSELVQSTIQAKYNSVGWELEFTRVNPLDSKSTVEGHYAVLTAKNEALPQQSQT